MCPLFHFFSSSFDRSWQVRISKEDFLFKRFIPTFNACWGLIFGSKRSKIYKHKLQLFFLTMKKYWSYEVEIHIMNSNTIFWFMQCYKLNFLRLDLLVPWVIDLFNNNERCKIKKKLRNDIKEDYEMLKKDYRW